MSNTMSYALCSSCDTPLTAGYEINGNWDKCLSCKIREDGYDPYE